ncbi:TlpA family protein disulfide reductase [Mucilaginibacter sp. UR6-1]|uniref:TlpA family protein disulfide reductase n=1 Tax=Mucilaginibacter sp. UR6-1 TaxID=1435643 RepID=UPI001E554CFB|nr:TlpA disulfide reductase family protein [Mucilaginibacter sp. UR6-1]MCC8407734.1 TlpA family protein disulfide reductase [Mucilaginibacter sp. UR6-1]
MKLKICLLGVLCLFFQARSHAQNTPKYLKPGDKMPDLEITNIINWKHKSARISDFKGKVIILDFWNTFCSGCIAGFPHLDSLQRQFGNKLQVILVNPASNQETMRRMNILLDRMNSWSDQKFILPIAFRDSTIYPNFEFYGVPFGVWIDPDGSIVGFPQKSEITAANIAALLAGKKIDIKQIVVKKPKVTRKVTL